MKRVVASVLVPLAGIIFFVCGSGTAGAAARAPTESFSHDGLVFNIPNGWSIYSAAQTAECGVPAPVVIIGNSEDASLCHGGALPVVGTIVHILPNGALGTYEDAVREKPSSVPGETTRTQMFTHDGVSVLLTTTHRTDNTGWIVEAYFKNHPFVVLAVGPRGRLGSSMNPALAVVESVRPTSVHM